MAQELSVHFTKLPPTLSKKKSHWVPSGKYRGGEKGDALERSTRFSLWNETSPRVGPAGFGFRQKNKTRGKGARFSSKKIRGDGVPLLDTVRHSTET